MSQGNDSNVKCVTSDIRIACNKMDSYTAFLSDKIAVYHNILGVVQENAICDELIAAKLSALAERTGKCGPALQMISNHIRQIAQAEISEIDAADNFVYPHALLAKVSSMLARFM